MNIDKLIDIFECQKECVLYSQEMQCNTRCQNCYFHTEDYLMIDALEDILKILKEKQNDNSNAGEISY